MTQPLSVGGVTISAVTVAAGGYHTCGIFSDRMVRCWGLDNYGQLGNGVSGQGVRSGVPVLVTGISAGTPVALATGAYHSCVLLSSGTVQCWGYNNDGQIGNGVTGSPVTTAVAVTGISNAVAIAAGGFHSCAILTDDSISCWGRNSDNQTSAERISSSGVPNTVPGSGRTPGPPITTAAAIAAGIGVGEQGLAKLGGYHTCAVLSDGSGRCWGYGHNGVLGNGIMTSPDAGTFFVLFGGTSPVKPFMGPARSIAAGAYHTCVIVTGGLIQCWGHGDDGEFGNNAKSSSGFPTTTTLPAGRTASVIAAGGFHTCAVLTTATSTPANEVWCWGNNGDGQLGDLTRDNRVAPTQVSLP
jgi:alpha-tubulin suppressor-like RCC1 family protein